LQNGTQPNNRSVTHALIVNFPADVNFLEAIVLPKDQLYLGRG
jgi:hypothetical protein